MIFKNQRVPAICVAFIAYLCLLMKSLMDIWGASSGTVIHPLFSYVTAFIYLVVGAFVWLYASNRRIAFLLFGFCCSIMVSFCVENQTSSDILLRWFGVIGSISAVLFLSDLLNFFPREEHVSVHGVWRRSTSILLYLWITSIVGSALISYDAYLTFARKAFPFWYNSVFYGFFAIELALVFVRVIVFYSRIGTRRDRQQLFLLVWGIILTSAPLLFLTIVPQLLGFSWIDPNYSAATLCLFPFVLGYSILRYQILVFDTYVRRIVSFVAGVAFIITLVFAVVSLSEMFLHRYFVQGNLSFFFLTTCLVALVAPLAWWLAKLVTERLFFREILHYRRLLDEPAIITNEVMSVSDAASLLTSAAIHTFDTSSLCVFSLDEIRGQFTLYPPLTDQGSDAGRRALFESLRHLVHPEGDEHMVEALDARLLLFRRIERSQRPLLLREALRPAGDEPVGLERYMTVRSAADYENWMLAPLRAQGKVIGLLVLGERGDRQPYAGPDLEAAHLLLNRFSPVLESARLYERAQQHAVLLNRLSGVSLMPNYTFQTAEGAADIYARVAAEATAAASEVWFYDDAARVLRRVAEAGNTPHIAGGEDLEPILKSDWLPFFFRGGILSSMQAEPVTVTLPSCLRNVSTARAFAWLPLQKDGRRLGVLVITYEGYHHFAKEEMRILEMFATQCVVALENVRMTSDLLKANERLKELDYLKDQFITTASHELRTPLTALTGYVELLGQYHAQLPPSVRADFIEKARRGCDELTLLVSNIMDASQMSAELELIRVRPVPLRATIEHVLEIMEPIIVREERTVSLAIDKSVTVYADETRLRQVLMNLLSNALKYSATGTALVFSSQVNGPNLRVSVRDYGAGILPEEQDAIFERFVRLERDMNSPVRGAGLGLFICRQLIEAMGGHIWVESSGQDGEGSTFSFSLRLASAALVYEQNVAHQLA